MQRHNLHSFVYSTTILPWWLWKGYYNQSISLTFFCLSALASSGSDKGSGRPTCRDSNVFIISSYLLPLSTGDRTEWANNMLKFITWCIYLEVLKCLSVFAMRDIGQIWEKTGQTAWAISHYCSLLLQHMRRTFASALTSMKIYPELPENLISRTPNITDWLLITKPLDNSQHFCNEEMPNRTLTYLQPHEVINKRMIAQWIMVFLRCYAGKEPQPSFLVLREQSKTK